MTTKVRFVNTEEVSNELIYYNLDVINSSQVDTGTGSDPNVKFEETRSTPILADASKYNFSIVRFTINGANKDLPLFIPIANKVQSNTTEAVVVSGTNNLFYITYPDTAQTIQLTYAVTITTGTYTTSSFLTALSSAITTALSGGTASTYKPTSVSVSYVSNTNNVSIVFNYSGTGLNYPTHYQALLFYDQTTYATLGSATLFGGWVTSPPGTDGNPVLPSPNFVTFPNNFSSSITRSSPTPVEIQPYTPINTLYDTIYSVTIAGQYTKGTTTYTITPVTKFITWYPETTDVPQPSVNPDGTINQRISDKYWWCYTYKHWVDCVNRTLTDVMTAVATQLTASTGTTITLISNPPVVSYNQNTNLFSIAFDSYGFGCNTNTYLNALVSSVQSGYTLNIVSPINQDQRLCNTSGTIANENFSLFFNSNMFGLFTNFNNIYYGLEAVSNNGMDNLIVCSNEQTASYNPYAFNTTSGTIVATSTLNSAYPKVLFIATQDYASTSSLWSPIASIVFCSTLLPTLPENISAPVVLNSGNNTSQNTSLNAFTPIITDISLPMATAGDYRQFISYTPSAEYRLTSLGTSQVDVREMNISVFWKHRLTGELVPLTLFNQSSVSLKILFRKRNGGK